MNNDEEEYVTKTESYSTVASAKGQNQQCSMTCDNRPRKERFNWSRLLSYLPSWMKSSSPAGPAGHTITASIPNPAVQICHAHRHTPIESEKKCSKRTSYERVISNYNFDNGSTDQKSVCEHCKQKGWLVCGKHSSDIESASNTKHVQVECAEVSSHKTDSRCGVCSNRQAQKTSINSSCQQSLLEQAWEYIQSIIFTHRTDCARCNQRPPCPKANPPCTNAKPPCPKAKPPCPNAKPPCPKAKPPCPNAKPPCPNTKPCVNRRSSNDSSCCKESLLDLVKAYLKKITSAHKSDCPRCSQQPSCSREILSSCLRNMFEQAWCYIKKSCEQKTCQQQGALSCCTPPSSRMPVCSSPGILKYPSSKANCCCTESVPDCSKKQACQAVSCPKPVTCPKLCEHNTPPTHPCKSEEEGTHEHKSCYTPCCIHNSQGVQMSYTSGSHHKSCCLSQIAITPPKITLCTKSYKDSTPPTLEKLKAKVLEKFSGSMLGREIIGFHSSTECAGLCTKDSNVAANRPIPKPNAKPGLSLSMEPNDHKFCTRPEECKHSKESLECLQQKPSLTVSACEIDCSAPCNVLTEPTFEQEAQTAGLPCCANCKSQAAAAPMYDEKHRVGPEYENFLDEQLGKVVARKMLDKETICEEDCNCVTCITNIPPVHKEHNKTIRKDPHNYRYYY